MSVGKFIGICVGNPNDQEIAVSAPVPVPSPVGGGTRDGTAILGASHAVCPDVAESVGTGNGKQLGKMEAHKAKLSADPRFAGWVA